ncbi:MAG: CHAT domain-containing protein [Cyanobacteria bacterium P01_H01_bin.21]
MSNPKAVKILVLSANPVNTDQLRLNAEVRDIKEALDRVKYRDRVELLHEGAVRIDDLSLAILKHEPDIVHFSGHGTGKPGLVLEDDNGKAQLVSTDALSRLFKWGKSTVKCVFLNACFSKNQANAIHQHIDCVIGMNQSINDHVAIKFAAKFYQALVDGESFRSAYEYACTALDLSGGKESSIPELLNRIEESDPLALAMIERSQTPQSQPAEPSSILHAQQSQSVGNISVNGSNIPLNIIQSGGNVSLTQTNTQTSGDHTDLKTALDALVKLKKAVLATDALSAFSKKDTESKIDMLREELQKSQPDKGFVNEVVEALKQGLNGVVTLASAVNKVATLIAKAWENVA